jgi:hypothetical protein
VRLGDVARLCQEQRQGLFGGGDDVGLRGVDDHDAAAGRLLDIDVVEPDAGARHHLQRGGRGQHLGGHLRGASDDEGVIRADLGGERSRRELGPHVDLKVLGQQIEPLGGQGLGHQHAHGQWVSWKTCSAAATAAPSLTG